MKRQDFVKTIKVQDLNTIKEMTKEAVDIVK